MTSDPPEAASATQEGPERTVGAGGVLGVSVAAGLVAGALEAATALGERIVSGRMLLFGNELVWVTPLVEAVIFAALGGLYALLALALRPLRKPRAVTGTFAALGAFAVLAGFDALHLAASALLAAGLASVLARRTGRDGLRLGRRALRFSAAGLLAILVVGGTMTLLDRRTPAGQDSAGRGDRRVNVLLLVLDTVRAWNLSLYGHARNTTPLLDRRFGEGIVFDRALATAPWTLPSHASLFTGRHPLSLVAGWDRPLDGTRATLAEVLADAGYATGGFVGNYRYAGAATGLARGFERYDDYPIDLAEGLRMTGVARRILRIGAVQTWLGRNRIIEARPASEVNARFLDWVDRRGDRPFFGFINYVDAHSPYLPPSPFDSLWTRSDPARISARYAADVANVFGARPIPPDLVVEYLDGYDGALSYLDQQIDSLLGALERRGLLENTLVVLTSDHGEHFGEHGLIQHGNSLYLPLLHVPLAIYGPGLVPGGLRIAEPTSLVNVAATITDLAGVAAPELGGHSLAPLWGADSLSVPIEEPLASVDWHKGVSRFPPSTLLGGSLRGILRDNLHYIRRSDGAEELYDVSRDFLEARNLVGAPAYRPELLVLRAALDSATGADRGPGPPR